jgi:hypothetical protein
MTAVRLEGIGKLMGKETLQRHRDSNPRPSSWLHASQMTIAAFFLPRIYA